MANSETSTSTTTGKDTTVQVIGFDVERKGTTQSELSSNTASPSVEGCAFISGSPLPVSIPPVLKAKEPTDTVSLQEEKSNVSDLTRQLTPRIKAATSSSSEVEKPPMHSTARDKAQQRKEKAAQVGASATSKKKSTVEKKVMKSSDVETPCLSLFDHLDQFQSFSKHDILHRPEAHEIDAHFLSFCVSYGEQEISESKACLLLLEAFHQSADFFQSDEALFYTREYLAFFNHQIGFLVSCRPLNISMRNSIKTLKVEISRLKSGIGLGDGKASVKRVIRNLIEERVDVHLIVAKEASDLFKDNDTVLTFASSETVFTTLSHAWQIEGRRFRVMIVDSRPDLSGKQLLKKLSALGIPCTYLMLNAVSFALKGVSKVLLGASAVLSNGTIMGFAGTAAIAALAYDQHIPIIFCCQTLKFHDNVQLDAFTHNELSNPQLLKSAEMLNVKEPNPYVSWLNLKYDLTPSSFVSVIVTELGFVPASSVPIILREQATDQDSITTH